jgi:hypothetical protein
MSQNVIGVKVVADVASADMALAVGSSPNRDSFRRTQSSPGPSAMRVLLRIAQTPHLNELIAQGLVVDLVRHFGILCV